MTYDSPLTAAFARTKLLVLDVDGVLTDGSIQYVGDLEGQTFNVKDGLGLNLLRRAGVKIAWITGRGCEVTRRRAEELGVEELHMGARDKLRTILAIQERLEVRTDETVAMGDDLPDLAMRTAVGLLTCPADAAAEVREAADWTAAFGGGRGAVRQLCEAILKARGEWAAMVVDVVT